MPAWCLYDWAYSAFNTVVVTFVIPTYFVRAVAPDPVTGTAAWAGAQTVAGLVIAVVAAPLGALADAGGRRRALLGACTGAMALLTAALWFVRPRAQDATLALILVAAATVAFEMATVFYNAMLPDIATPDRLGRVSGLAWAAGYAGGLVCLSLCLWALIAPDPPCFGLSRAAAEPVRATALLASGWIALFSWPLLVFGPRELPRLPWRAAAVRSRAMLGDAVRRVVRNRSLRRFLLARMLYTDGLTALFAFGGIYASGSFGMDARQVLLLGIALNVTAGLGAAGFALIEDRIGAKAAVLTALAGLVACGSGALLARSTGAFWACALGLGLFVGSRPVGQPQPDGPTRAGGHPQRRVRALCPVWPRDGLYRAAGARRRHRLRRQPARGHGDNPAFAGGRRPSARAHAAGGYQPGKPGDA